ncbi:MAG: MerR family transcriptional regulator [Candidatus Jordarchaeum sp.]
MERLYTLKEAKQLLSVTTQTIQKWDKQTKLRAVRTAGGRRPIPENEIKRLLNIHEQRKITGYTRVPQASQRNDLQRQRELSQTAGNHKNTDRHRLWIKTKNGKTTRNSYN